MTVRSGSGLSSRQAGFVWGTLLVYAIARVCQLYADRLPTLFIVILHVIPPAVFALFHGSCLYGRRGMAVFAAFCLGFGVLAESIGLRTGFPFGRYYFTDVMGPKIFELPVLLALAYLGMGYVSWILALLILDCAEKPLSGMRVPMLPLVASLIMVAWDLSMEPNWSTLDGAWIWQDGGSYFGFLSATSSDGFLPRICITRRSLSIACRARFRRGGRGVDSGFRRFCFMLSAGWETCRPSKCRWLRRWLAMRPEDNG